VVGKGSIFSFELPLEKKKSDPIEAVWEPLLSDPEVSRDFFPMLAHRHLIWEVILAILFGANWNG
jgi:hypothetical protein